MTTYITDPAAAGDPATDLGGTDLSGTDLGEALSLRRRIPVQLAQPLVDVAAREQIMVIGFPKATDIDFGPLGAQPQVRRTEPGRPTHRVVADVQRAVDRAQLSRLIVVGAAKQLLLPDPAVDHRTGCHTSHGPSATPAAHPTH